MQSSGFAPGSHQGASVVGDVRLRMTLISRAMFAHLVYVQSCPCVIDHVTVLACKFLMIIVQVLMSQYFSNSRKTFATHHTLHTSCVRPYMLMHLYLRCCTILTMLARYQFHIMVI